MASVFYPDRFARLAAYLNDVLSHPEHFDPGDVAVTIDRHRAEFLQLYKLPPPNAEERNQIEKGELNIDGNVHRLNNESIQCALFLSRELGISEKYAASLVKGSLRSCSRYGRPVGESAVMVLHAERLDMLLCMRRLLEGCLDEELEGSPLQIKLKQVAIELATTKQDIGSGKGKVMLGQRILVEINELQDQINKLQSILQAGTPSSSTTGLLGMGFQGVGGASAGQTQQHLSDDIILERIRLFKLERKALAQILFYLAYARIIPKEDLIGITQWLQVVQRIDSVVVYVFTALLAALSANQPPSAGTPIEPSALDSLNQDVNFITFMQNEIMKKNWAKKDLKAGVLLQWSLFLVDAFLQRPSLPTATRIEEADVENMVQLAIVGADPPAGRSVFHFLAFDILAFKARQSDDEIDLEVAVLAEIEKPSLMEDDVDGGFHHLIVQQVDMLVTTFISKAGSMLKRVRDREEDLMLAASRRSRPPSHQVQRHDLESLFTLVAIIYRNQPDAGLKFWEDRDGRLFSFLRFAAECRSPHMVRAALDMLGSLATGTKSALCAYEFLSSSGGQYGVASSGTVCSWKSLFGALDFYGKNIRQKMQEAGAEMHPAGLALPPEEVMLLKSFLRLMRLVVWYSPFVRSALYNQHDYEALPTIFNLLTCPSPLDLKAALFDTLAAFASPKGVTGPELARHLWLMLDDYQIIATAPRAQGPRSVAAMRESGITVELEEVETPAGVYPSTTAFIRFLAALVHVPTKLSDVTHGAAEGGQTVPESFRLSTRGVEPFINFAIDRVFSTLSQRPFKTPSDAFKLREACLRFMENCLASYDLGILLTADLTQGGRVPSAVLTSLVLHPGFAILGRILAGRKVLEELLSTLAIGCDAVNEGVGGPESTTFFSKSVLRALRIIYRVFELQKPFLEALLPSLTEQGVPAEVARFVKPTNLSPLDRHLVFAHENVVPILLYVNCIVDDEIALYAIRIAKLLSQSSEFASVHRFGALGNVNRLLGLIETSDETERLVSGYVQRLNAEASDDEAAPTMEDSQIAQTSPEEPGDKHDLTELIRITILDFLLLNTAPDSSAPNFAHLLLGFDWRSEPDHVLLQDPSNPMARISCLHVILNLVKQGLKGTESEDAAVLHITERRPKLAERCYNLLYNLCVHNFTASATVLYLRTNEDFFYCQLRGSSLEFAPSADGSPGQVILPSGEVIPAGCDTVSSIVRVRAWILDLVSLELHINRDFSRAGKMMAVLYGDAGIQGAEFDSAAFSLEGDGAARVERATVKLLGFLQSFDFDWEDSLEVPEIELSLLSDVDFTSCVRVDANGCEVYDIPSLLVTISVARQRLQREGIIREAVHMDTFKDEVRAVLEHFLLENHQRIIACAKQRGIQAWRRVLDVSLSKWSHLLRPDLRENVLFDILQALLVRLAATEVTPGQVEVLTGAVLTIVTRLRYGRLGRGKRESAIDDEYSEVLPVDRLVGVLRAVLDTILKPGMTALAHGNLYAVLVNYIQIVNASRSAITLPNLSDSMSVVSSEMMEPTSVDGSLVDGAVAGRAAFSSLEKATFRVLNTLLERVLLVMCRDALDGSDVWKTVALTTLDAIVALCSQQKSNKALGLLNRHGFLRSFVESLKDEDIELQELVKPEPAVSVAGLYVYEARLALLIRIAQSREGAECLMDARLFDVLASVDFIACRPAIDSAVVNYDSFLPAAIERYHQLVLPVLQLSVAVLSSFGTSSSAAARQAWTFTLTHGGTLLNLVRQPTIKATLTAMEEARTVVTMLYFVWPLIWQNEVSAEPTLGSLHSGVLSLCAVFFSREMWTTRVQIMDEGDEGDAMRDEREGPAVDANAEAAVQRLNKSLVAYLRMATEAMSSNKFHPVFTPSMNVAREGNVPDLASSTAPTMGAAVALVAEQTRELRASLADLEAATYKLAKFDGLAPYEYDELVDAAGDGARVTGGARRKQVAYEVLNRQKAELTDVVGSKFYVVENMLLLLWRHIEVYLSVTDGRLEDEPVRVVTPRTLDFAGGASLRASVPPAATPSVDRRSLRTELAKQLKPVLGSLAELTTTSEIVRQSRSRQAFLEMVIRRIESKVPTASGV